MAFKKALSGDRLGMDFSVPSVFPKAYGTNYIAAWAAALATPQTVPAVGDLVKQDTTAGLNDGVRQCAAGDVIYGMVISVNSSNGTLSVIKIERCHSLILELGSGALALGDQVVADGSAGTIFVNGVLRNRIKRDNTNGNGLVVALIPATGTVLQAIIEWPSGLRAVT